MDSLPVELLERVLVGLAPADLIACRAVCARWRAVVRALEAADAPFKFACGLTAQIASGRLGDGYADRVGRDLVRSAPSVGAHGSRQSNVDEENRSVDVHAVVRAHVRYIADSILRSTSKVALPCLVPCACGRPDVAWFCDGEIVEDVNREEEAASVTRKATTPPGLWHVFSQWVYALFKDARVDEDDNERGDTVGRDTAKGDVKHSTGHRHLVPLTRWRYLAGELALAQQLTDVCGPVDGRLFLAGFAYNSDQVTWFPYFLHTQSRPVSALLARANSVEDIVAALKTDTEIAEAFGAHWSGNLDVQDFAQWWPRCRERLDERVADWAAARPQMSAAVFVQKHMSYRYGPTTYPWLGMTSGQLTEGLVAQQRYFDAMVRAFERLARFPFVVNTCTEYYYCIVGLSPSANLVGVRIALDYR